MDYKEKYEMALEGIQEILGSGEDSIKMSRLQLRLQGIFPELKESEGKDIKQFLIDFIKVCGWTEKKDQGWPSKEKCIAWLEKQGEQKPAEWSEEDEARFESCIKILQTSDGYDTINVKWLKSLKDRVQPQPKQEWSKEAENNILFLTSIIKECFKDKEKITLCGDTVCANFTKENVIDRLKSLRPQKQWKPSLAQLNALSIVSKGNAPDDMEAIVSLYNDLKKLREE